MKNNWSLHVKSQCNKSEIKLIENCIPSDDSFDGFNQIIDNSNDLLYCIVENNKQKDNFVIGIEDILQKMKNILYSPPYNILFGRFNVFELKQKNIEKKKYEEINESFYKSEISCDEFDLNLNGKAFYQYIVLRSEDKYLPILI